MYNEDTDVLFPPRIISSLDHLRGEPWQELIKQVANKPPTATERLAFVLMMVRLGSCLTCHSDSFRAMRGCTICAVQSIRRFRGSDLELLKQYDEAYTEIKQNFTG